MLYVLMNLILMRDTICDTMPTYLKKLSTARPTGDIVLFNIYWGWLNG